MANFNNLKEIFDESRLDQSTAAGDELLSIALRNRVEVSMWKKASELLAGVGLPEMPEFPTDEQRAEINQQRNELIGWAQRIIAGDGLKMMLASADNALSKQDILALTDVAVDGLMEPLIASLAKGHHPGR